MEQTDSTEISILTQHSLRKPREERIYGPSPITEEYEKILREKKASDARFIESQKKIPSFGKIVYDH